ncbi:MAG: hypothetical protein GMKNLPBB_02021 [Myxococcota bacterium]|nr:hypothetical protein [Myxococcota bacterium]
MASPAHIALAGLQDLLNTPEGVKAELIDGVLHTEPRPAGLHAESFSSLGGILKGPFQFGMGGPGGWIILQEHTVKFGDDYLVPDLSGWKRERLPLIPRAPFIEIIPDWVCEILSPRSAGKDRIEKLNHYKRHGVPWYWILDPMTQVLEVLRLHDGQYVLDSTHTSGSKIRPKPFDAIELDLGLLWESVEPEDNPEPHGPRE